jgi:hypothetical protein
MKRFVWLGALCFLIISGLSGRVVADDTEVAIAVEDAAPEIEITILDDGTEEIQEIRPEEAYAPVVVDERYLAIKIYAKQRIHAILEEIEGLADRSAEGELQRQIEQIKMDAEIERLTLLKEDAENRGDALLADELADEIDHREQVARPDAGRSRAAVSRQEMTLQEGGRP